MTKQGNLAATVGGEDFKLLKPVAYQTSTNASGKVAVDAGYRIDAASGNARIGFTLGSYDRSQPLVIDPVLTYGLYLSGVDLGGDSSTSKPW